MEPSRANEVDPLLVKDYRSNIMMLKGPSQSTSSTLKERRRCCKGRSAVTTTAFVAVILLSAALIYLLIFLEEGTTPEEGPVIVDESVLPEDQTMVEVSSSGVYSVRYVGPSDGKTFAELAHTMLPPWYTASRMAMNDILQKDTMDPSNVKNARQALLTTRDLLDVFSPVFPTKGIWESVRSLYKEGYDKVGYYQDLDHAHVAFSQSLWDERRDTVLDWKDDFEYFDSHHDIHGFLTNDVDTDGCYDHSESHLFWGELEGYLPCGDDLATSSLQKLVVVQLNNALDLLQTILKFDTVLPKKNEELFHDFRKELRSVLDEWNLFGLTLFPSAEDVDSPVQDCLNTFQVARNKLGDINDNWTAYNLYMTRKEHEKKAKNLAIVINKAWDDFKLWVVAVNLPLVIQTLLDEIM